MLRIFFSLLAGSPFALIAQEGRFQLSGKIGGTIAGDLKIYMAEPDTKKVVDSSVLTGGTFRFTGTISDVHNYVLFAARASSAVEQVLAKTLDQSGKPDFTTIYLKEGITTLHSAGPLKEAVVSGASAQVNAEYKEVMTILSDWSLKMSRAANASATGSDSVKNDTISRQEQTARLMALEDELQRSLAAFVQGHSSSSASLMACSFIMPRKPSYARELFNGLSAGLKNSSRGKAFAARLEQVGRVYVGAHAPDFELPGTNGQPVRLGSFRGKYVLLEFWASWCAPCRAANPELIRIYNKYKGAQFTIIGVSIDRSEALWLEAVKKDGLPWINVCDPGKDQNRAALLYSVTGVPMNFLVDPQGVIIATGLIGKPLEEKLDQLLGR